MIQEATIKDAKNLISICTLYKKNFNELYDIEYLLKNNINKIYLHKENDIIKGFIILEIIYETVSVLHLYVREEERNKKIASNLIDYIISEFNEAQNIILEVRVDNNAAINLYKKFNFQVINTRKKYYNGIDAYVMERKISYE